MIITALLVYSLIALRNLGAQESALPYPASQLLGTWRIEMPNVMIFAEMRAAICTGVGAAVSRGHAFFRSLFIAQRELIISPKIGSVSIENQQAQKTNRLNITLPVRLWDLEQLGWTRPWAY
jgi:hypothetical protein